MANNWAPEPIKCENGHLFDASGEFLVSPDCVMEQATGDRLAACYNACAEVPTENLRLLNRIHEFNLGVDDNGKDYCYFGPFDSQKDAIGFALFAIAAQPLDKEAADGQGDRSPAEAD